MRRLARQLRFGLALLVALLVLMAPGALWAQSDLERAYKKEFTYLEAQKSALAARLEQMKREDAARVRAEQGKVDRLQGRVLSLTLDADRIQGELMEAESEASAVSENQDVLAATLEQARASLSQYGRALPELPENTPDEARVVEQAKLLSTAFDEALQNLETLQSKRREQGAFFLPDGTQVEGTIVYVGNVAAYGVSDRGAGALAPAGDGRLRLWSKPSEATAKALASGEYPDQLEIFLYENLERNVEEKQEKTWQQILEDGGAVGWVIVALGLLGVLLVVWRVLFLLFQVAGMARLVEAVDVAIARGDIAGAKEICARGHGAASRVLEATVGALGRQREEVEDVIAEALLHETPGIERFSSSVTVFAAVAPLLGLLGTVTGMISTFDIITEFGTGDPKMLSGGISIALITTQLGLIVAIPLLLLGNMTSGLANNILVRLERAALRVVNRAGEGEGDSPEMARATSSEPTEDRALDGDFGLAGAE